MATRSPPATPADGPAYPLNSVDNALRLLLLFRSRPSVRVSEVAEHLDIARSTAHRLLVVLVHREFAVQDPVTRAYSPGPRLMEVGLAAVGALDLRARMHPYLAKLAATTSETVSLLVMEGDTVHFIDGIESQLTVRVSARLGGRKPAHSTSAGKAILAALPEVEVLALYPDESLAGVTDRTLTNRTSLLAELDQIRADGFATNFEESEGGLGAVGRAVLDADGRPAAGIAVAVPMQRMSREYVLQIAGELAIVTAAASADLGQDGRLAGI